MPIPEFRVAIVHEWFATYAGSERVVEQLLRLYPDADLYGIVDFLPPDQRQFLQGKPIKTTFMQRIPGARKWFRHMLPLMPIAVESLDLSGYQLVLSSSHALAKGILTGPDQIHICYCHSPMRYAWDLQRRYLVESGLTSGVKGALTRAMLSYMRMWDVRTANGVDHFVANSRYIARRIWKVYRREAKVIPPPVDTVAFTPNYGQRDDFYLSASRLAPYKQVNTIVEAFRHLPDRRLIVIGDGPMRKQIEERLPANVTYLGYQPDAVLRDYLQRARAFVFAAEEDFGIAPVEAMACGAPVIAFGRGGILDSVIEGKTGLFFDQQTPESIGDAIRRFEGHQERYAPEFIRENALRFSPDQFRRQFQDYVDKCFNR